MKRCILRHKLALWLVATLALTACSQDELADNGQDTLLPVGKYPLELTAAIGEAVAMPATRGTVHGTWPEGGFNLYSRVASSIDCPDENEIDWWNLKPEVQTTGYVINADGTVVWNTNYARPVYWRRTDEKIYFYAYSWACIPDERNTLIPHEILEDQSKDIRFEQSDYLFAYEVLTFGGDNTLNFRHLTSKITINLMRSDYLDAQDPEDVEVTLTGKNGGNWCIKGKFKGRKPNEITLVEDESREKSEIIPYKNPNPVDGMYATYEAVLIPQTITGTGKTIQIKVGKTTYSYEVKCPKNQYTSGEEWIYNITVDAKGLKVSVEENISWGTDGATGSGSVTLPDEVINLGDGIPVEIKDDRTYLITGTGTQTITIDGSPTITFKEVALNSGTAIEITGGSPKLVFEGTNSLESTANGKGAISLSGGASVDISGGGTLSLKANTTDMYGDGWKEGAILGSAGGEQCGNISISGVTLDIEANIYNAAIGSGEYNSSCGDIIITDATIHITGCKGGAGIGTSRANAGTSSCGDIRIKNSDIEIEYGNMSALQGAAIGCAAGGLSSSSSTYYPNTVKGIYVTLKSGQSQSDFLDKLTTTSATGSDKVGYGYNEGDNRKYGSITDGIHWYDAGGTEINE